MDVFERILSARGLNDNDRRQQFIKPSYEAGHDPFLLPDMQKAVDRLVRAREYQETITIYGDYDIDGLTATTLLLDAFESFGFENVSAFIPNRFVEGYGMTVDAVEKIAKTGAKLIVTVDCGSLSEAEIVRASELGIDVIVTDHHNVAPIQPPAVAVINPKRLLQDFPEAYEELTLKDFKQPQSQHAKSIASDQPKLYPFLDLPGVGVAFKLVQALQTRLDGLEKGQEKWLLDLVALGTVCDVVRLHDENRTHVYWGLEVMKKTRRPGLKALMAVAGVVPNNLNARALGFGLGPRMNAAGRLETAQIALDMLRAKEGLEALKGARQLDELNAKRRREQDEILKKAIIEAEKFSDDPVLVLTGQNWNHGIIGIVAAKLLEKYAKPTFVLEDMGGTAKGSARSYGDFSAVDAIRASDDIITKGGGHKLAAGVTLPSEAIGAFRQRVNQFYASKALKLDQQQKLRLPREDTEAKIIELNLDLVEQIMQLEPFGSGNEAPILLLKNVTVIQVRRLGADSQHIKLTVAHNDRHLECIAFSAPSHFFVDVGSLVDIFITLEINEWRGTKSLQGRLLHLATLEQD